MDSDLLFVKEQIGVQERLAAKYASQPHRAGLHISTAERFRALLARLQILEETDKDRVDHSKRVNVSLADLDDIPPELLNELSINESDLQEMIIEDLIIKNSGIISLDKLIVRFYQRQKEILKRNTLTSKLYRMAEKGMIFNVPGRRGYYSTYELNESDIRKIFGKPEVHAEVEPVDVSQDEPQPEEGGGRILIRRRRRPYPIETT